MTAPSANQYVNISINDATSTSTATATSTTSTSISKSYSKTNTITYTQELFLSGNSKPVMNVYDTAVLDTNFVFDFNIDHNLCKRKDWVLAGIGRYADVTPTTAAQVQICGYTLANTDGTPGEYVALTTPLSIPLSTDVPPYLSFQTQFNSYLAGITLVDSSESPGDISYTFQYYSASLADAGKTMPISCDPPIINDQ